jgi:hypothetical protein
MNNERELNKKFSGYYIISYCLMLVNIFIYMIFKRTLGINL